MGIHRQNTRALRDMHHDLILTELMCFVHESNERRLMSWNPEPVSQHPGIPDHPVV
jgi:hypothetical protein